MPKHPQKSSLGSGAPPAPPTLFTIGHSTHPIEEFLQLLVAYGIELVADIRTIPRSRRHPQYNSALLAHALEEAGIAYRHLPDLGGLRRSQPGSLNGGWRNSSFRGYADHMQSEEFKRALTQVINVARSQRTALMCAEAVPWRCHRSLVSDALVARGIPVEHILSAVSSKPHALTDFAQVEGEEVTYPAAQPSLFASL